MDTCGYKLVLSGQKLYFLGKLLHYGKHWYFLVLCDTDVYFLVHLGLSGISHSLVFITNLGYTKLQDT